MADFDTTNNHGGSHDLPFPTGSANPDIPRDFKALAQKVDEELDGKSDDDHDHGTDYLTRGGTDNVKLDDNSTTAKDWVPSSGGRFEGDLRVDNFLDNTTVRTWLDTFYINTTSNAFGKIAYADGTVGNNGITFRQVFSSSREFKDEITTFDANPDRDMLSAFDKIHPARFRYKSEQVEGDYIEPRLLGTEHVGFIAEDVKAAGVAVVETPDGKVAGLRDSELIAVLWSKVQQLEQRVAELEANNE